MKRLFLAICLLFTFSACTDVSILNDFDPVGPSGKSIVLGDVPKNWSSRLEDFLESDGWDVAAINNGRQNFLLEFGKVTEDRHYAMYTGNVTVYDLRSRKKVLFYSFIGEARDDVFDYLVKALKKLEK